MRNMMVSFPFLITLLTTCVTLTLSRPTPSDNAVGIIWTFPNETWIENLAVRQNGEILATSLSRAAVYLVNPFEHTATIVHQFDDGVLGIAETEPDLFILATSNVNLKTSKAAKGSSKLWTLDMSAWEIGHDKPVSLVSHLKNVLLPDGIVALPEQGLVLVADAAKGVIWRVDTFGGDYGIAISDPSFKPSNPAIPLGVDGIHIAGGHLYFTNLGSNLLGRIPIDEHGHPTGPVENVTSSLAFPDDFALRADGIAYVAGANSLWKVGPQGSVKVLAGGINDTVLEGVTSAQFGRTSIDQDVLYLGTNGGMLVPVDGDLHGGQIAAVNVNALS